MDNKQHTHTHTGAAAAAAAAHAHTQQRQMNKHAHAHAHAYTHAFKRAFIHMFVHLLACVFHCQPKHQFMGMISKEPRDGVVEVLAVDTVDVNCAVDEVDINRSSTTCISTANQQLFTGLSTAHQLRLLSIVSTTLQPWPEMSHAGAYPHTMLGMPCTKALNHACSILSYVPAFFLTAPIVCNEPCITDWSFLYLAQSSQINFYAYCSLLQILEKWLTRGGVASNAKN
eukprot:1151860-Pelagomonas_calceolata.AAC.2